MFPHPSLNNPPSYENSPRKLPPLTFDQSPQQTVSFQRMPSMAFSGGNTPRIHPPPLLIRSPSRIIDPSSFPSPLRREMSIDIRPNNPFLERIPSHPSTRNSLWNQQPNIPDPYSPNIPSPSKFPSRHTSLSLNTPTMNPQFIDTRSQLSFRSPTEQSVYGFGFGFEAQMEKQNRMLNQLIGVMAKQDQIEKQRLRMDMNQKLKELELNKLKAEMELEKQRTYRQQQLQMVEEGLSSPRKIEAGTPRKEPSSLEKVVMSLIMKKPVNISPSKNGFSSERTRPFPSINERVQEEFQDDEEEEQSQQEVIEKPPRKRVVISRGNSTTRESTLTKLQIHQRTFSEVVGNPAGSLDYLNESSSPQRLSSKITPNNSKKSSEEEIASKNASIITEPLEKNPKKKKVNRVKILMKNENNDAILISPGDDTVKEKNVAKEESAIRRGIFKDLKRQQVLSKLRNVTWALVYPRVLYNQRKKHVMSDRQAFETTVSSNMGQIYEMSKMFIEDCAGKEILKMLTGGNFSYSLANLSESQAKKSEKMCIALVAHLKQIFNKLIVNMSNAPTVLLNLLGSLIEEDGFLQNDYFSLFEINRMKFGPFGTIREMNPQRCKLIIGGIFLVRIMIYYFLMRPWEMFKQDKSKFKTEKLLNVGSILYHTIMRIFKTSVPAYPSNQNFLSVDLRTKPKRSIQQAIDESEPENAQKVEKDADIMRGFIPLNQLDAFFEIHKKMAEELRQAVLGSLDAMYEKVSEVSG